MASLPSSQEGQSWQVYPRARRGSHGKSTLQPGGAVMASQITHNIHSLAECFYLSFAATHKNNLWYCVTICVMSIWSSIIDMLLSLSRYLINLIMIKFIHNQGHIKIIIFNVPQYDKL